MFCTGVGHRVAPASKKHKINRFCLVKTDMEIQSPFGDTKVKRCQYKENFRQNKLFHIFIFPPNSQFARRA